MLPTQEETDYKNPEEALLWCLTNMPTLAGIGAVTNPQYLKTWSRHLTECGVVHRDAIAALADENGMIHVSQLPKQMKKYQKPVRGAYHVYNNASRWVPMHEEAPAPTVIPDVRKMTLQEQNAVKHMLIETGVVRETTPKRDTARVTHD